MKQRIKYLKMDKLLQLCPNDQQKQIKYLKQFLLQISKSINIIESGLDLIDRRKVRQAIHFIQPQLLFFGIHNFKLLFVEYNMDEITFDEEVKKGLTVIKKSIPEVELIIIELESDLKMNGYEN